MSVFTWLIVYEGDKIIITENNYNIKNLDEETVPYYNGNIGTLVQVDEDNNYAADEEEEDDVISYDKYLNDIKQEKKRNKHKHDKGMEEY